MEKLSYVCTIGPSMEDMSMLEEMYKLGMTTIRFNMSYNHPKIYDLLKTAKELQKKHPDIELLFDSAGPEIRVRIDKPLEFKDGDLIILGKDFNLSIDSSIELNRGEIISIKDGDYVLEVLDKNNEGLYCRAVTDGVLKNNYKIYNKKLYNDLAFMSLYDEEIIKVAAINNIDSFAISFVRNAENIKQVKDMFKKYGKENIKIIAKIENELALNNLEEIIKASDEIMIARGDLSTILPRTNIGYYQKLICNKCRKLNKPVMVATGIMASMEKREDPTISEILDLYNIILDGINKIVFTGETSVANDPLDVLATANSVFETSKNLNN